MFSKFIKKNKNYLDSRSKNDLLHNIYVLYIIFIIALVDIFYMLQLKDYYSAFIFITVGIITSFFSKNMVVILCISMFVTHISKYGSNWKEGFESSENEEESTSLPDAIESSPTESIFHSITEAPIIEDNEDKVLIETLLEDNESSNDNETTSDNEVTEDNEAIDNNESTDGDLEKDVSKHSEQIKKFQKLEEKTSAANINKLLEKQSILLDKMNEYKPLLTSIQNISKNLGFAPTE